MSGFSMLPDLHFTGGTAAWPDARRLPREGLAQALVESRNRTLAWLGAFGTTRRGWTVPRQYDCNPPLWTLGHIAWHAEWWCLRGLRHLEQGGIRLPVASEPSLLDGADEWFDPDRIGPDERWEIALPDVARVKQYATQVLDGLLRRIALLPDDDDATLYPFRRALHHEDVQGETIATLLQALELAPAEPASIAPATYSQSAGTLHFPGGNFTQGWADADGFAWPDEVPAQKVYVPAFEMDASLVTNAQFLEFVEDRGYEHPSYWSAAGRQWLMTQERSAPRYWSRHAVSRSWVVSRFGSVRTLNPDEPVRHLTLFEAQAWCLWAGRRLPQEVEWELAATQNRGLQWGALREWTATPYEPYIGYIAEPTDGEIVGRFGTHQAVRGVSFASPARARHVRARMALLPEDDVSFVGFRTCAI